MGYAEKFRRAWPDVEVWTQFAANPRAFRTGRAGSLYAVLPDGRTIRIKQPGSGITLHTDGGLKPPSTKTVYLSPRSADIASAAYGQGLSPLSRRPLSELLLRSEAPVYRRLQFERDASQPGVMGLGRPVRELGYRDYDLEYTSHPVTGHSPLEFWLPEPGSTYRGFHLGSPIDEISLPGDLGDWWPDINYLMRESQRLRRQGVK